MTIHKLYTSLTSLAIVMLLAISCNSSSSTNTPENSGTTTAEGDGQRILDKETFTSGFKKSGAVLVDVRTPAEFEQGHIEGAININFFDPQFKYQLLELDRKKTYYLYCKNEMTSYRSMKFMEDNDFKHVYMLKGGFQEWNTEHAK